MINNIYYSSIKNKNNQKDQNVSEWNHGWKTGTTEAHIITYFQNFCFLTNCDIIFKWMLHHTIDYTLISTHWHFFITYTYTYTACIDYFIIYWFYNSLQYTFFIFTNNFYYAIKTIKLMTYEAVSFEKVSTERNF